MPQDEWLADLQERVSGVIRQAAVTAILPRFGQLARDDIVEKIPGELATVADAESEQILANGLLGILPDAVVVGEEACAADPSLVERIGEDLVWIVDPLDGTANFASGKGPFGIIVALAERGTVLAGWLYDPLGDRMCVARRGRGSWMRRGGGAFERLTVSAPEGRPVASLATQFMPPQLREEVLRIAGESFELQPIPRCAAEHYPRLCLGQNHIALFQRTLPWDHAAGSLLLTEAGGHVARWSGKPYDLLDGDAGILAATSVELLERASDILLGCGKLRDRALELLPQPLDPLP